MSEPYILTATEALSLMKSGELTVTAYATSLLSRIESRPEVKAWAYLNREQILSSAAALDEIPVEKRGPLHGLPVGVKDIILTKDMPTCYNSPIYADYPPPQVDASPVTTLRASGALIFGKTTTTEFASTQWGTATTNPHDSSRTPGGSSSGSGAVVGDFQVPISLGTQTVGSVIRPGSFNGIYAFKPTWNAISREGLGQYSITCDTLGLYTRSVSDLSLLASVFRLADDEPISSTPFSLSGAKIGFAKTHHWPKAGPGTRNAYTLAKKLLIAHGAIVEELELPEEFAGITKWHADILTGEGRSAFLGHYLLGKDKLDPDLCSKVENSTQLSRKAQLEAYDKIAQLRPQWDSIASHFDAVLTPSVVDEAPLGTKFTGDASFCGMWTVLGVPALNIPGFAGESGLPVGLTMVSGRYCDMHVLHVGQAVGDMFESEGGWKRKV